MVKMKKTDSAIPLLVVVGGGPKAAALAAKARVLKDLGKGEIRVKVLEREKDMAANWRGRSGYTTGNVQLCTPPEKDVGFPYTSIYGADVDKRMLAEYSWHAYKILVDKSSYSDWVDSGRDHPSHKEWADYLKYILMSGPQAKSYAVSDAFEGDDVVSVHESTEVQLIEPAKGKVLVQAKYRGRQKAIEADGVVLTGPGDPILIQDTAVDPQAALFDGRDYWKNTLRFSEMVAGKIAVVGGGETAASIVLSLLELTRGSSVSIDIINRHGAIFTRGESYNESRRFSNPRGWLDLEIKDREEFIRRTDRGVFSVGAQRRLNKARNIGYVSGEVVALRSEQDKIKLELRLAVGNEVKNYDAVIVALGFNPWTALNLLPSKFRPIAQTQQTRRQLYADLERSIDEYLCPSFEHIPGMKGVRFNVHLPMLAALSQGPGFPTLCSLGHLSDRIISRYVPPPKPAGKP
jgi:mycobactin lysine-N-oxygenase